MPDFMQKYVALARKMPAKRGTAERVRDHGEIYGDFTKDELQRQASRCEQCGVPYCQVYCPLHNNIPDWLKLTAEGRLEEAYQRAQETNNFPEICGRICPQDRLCEAKWACSLEQAGHGTVTIGAVERHITDNAWREGWVKPRLPGRERAQQVAIVGAGPAGMAAAEQLRAGGYQVDVFDRHQRMGGLMTYGIPGFKLEKSVVARREGLLLEAGVRFHPGCVLGRDIDLQKLRRSHDAVVLAYGAYRPTQLDIPGATRPGVVAALDYLVDSCRLLLEEVTESRIDAAGRRVVVVGGGDTAMDCLRTAVRQGAQSVVCLYRRDQANMPGSAREVAHAEEEGIEFLWQAQPEAFLGTPVEIISAMPTAITLDAPVMGLRAVRTHLSMPDPDGRSRPEVLPGSAFELQADLIINALGFSVEDPRLLSGGSVGRSDQGTVRIDRRTMMTEAAGVFAAGDAARGPSLAVWAIRDGRDVAAAVHRFVSAQVGQGGSPPAMAEL